MHFACNYQSHVTYKHRRRRFSTLSGHTSLVLQAAKLQKKVGNVFVWVREAELVELDGLGRPNTDKTLQKKTSFVNHLDAKHHCTHTRTSNVQRACMKVLPTRITQRLRQRRKSQTHVRRIILHFLDPRAPSCARVLSLRPVQCTSRSQNEFLTTGSCRNSNFLAGRSN